MTRILTLQICPDKYKSSDYLKAKFGSGCGRPGYIDISIKIRGPGVQYE